MKTRNITASANLYGELEFLTIVTFIYNYTLFSANVILFK
jgi:hypothetical protein